MIACYASAGVVVCTLLLDRVKVANVLTSSERLSRYTATACDLLGPLVQILSWLAVVLWAVQSHLE